MVAQAYDASTWEAEAELPKDQGQLDLHIQFKASLGYVGKLLFQINK